MSIAELISRDPVPELPPPAERVRLRKAFGITQGKLAESLGVSRQTVNRWEGGIKEPAGQNRADYAAVLNAWQQTEKEQKGK